MYDDLYDDFFKMTKTFFSNVDCGNCNNECGKGLENSACDFCSNNCEHTLLWSVNNKHTHFFVEELIKIVREHENDN